MPRRYLLAPLVLALAACGSPSDDTEPESTFTVDSYEAEAACQEFVERRLKAPSTADFDGWDSSNSGDTWTVSGQVDAENSFGAALRFDFTCVMDFDGDHWNLGTVTGLD